MDARKDYMAPLRMWQESRLHAGPYEVPEYEDFARMVKAMEDMNARIEELEGAADYTDGIWRFWNKKAREQTAKYLAEYSRAERAEAMLKEAVEALQVIADEKGKCEHCGKIAEGEGRGYVTCDGERDADYQPYYHCRWEEIDAAEFARATLTRIAQEGRE